MKSLLLAVFAFAAPAEPTFRVSIDRIEWVRLDPDRLQLAVYPRVDTNEEAALRRVRFERMSIGGMPFHLASAANRIVLPAENLPPTPVTIYLRDFAALTAIRQMVDAGEVSLRGEARFDLELPLLGRILLFSSTASVAAPISGRIPFVVPGGVFGRTAALAGIAAAQEAASLGSLLDQRLRPHEDWERRARDQAGKAAFPLTTTYTVDWQGQPPRTYEFHATGILITPNRLATPAEAAEPWRYDLDLAAAIAQGTATVRRDTVRIQCACGTLRAVRTDFEMEPAFLALPDGKRVRLLLPKRASNRNVAILELSMPMADALAPAADPSTEWDRLVIIRVTGPHPEILRVRARREGTRIVFADPVDLQSLGAPVFSSKGPIGFVQSETSAATIPNEFAQTHETAPLP